MGNCNPVELTIRDSYRRVTNTDYEPIDMDGVRFQAFGAFNDDVRRAYARNYGLVDSEWNRFQARYNLWERSHFYTDPAAMTGAVACATKATTEDPTGNFSADPNRDDNGNGTVDECEAAGAGSRCDVFSQKCTLPYRQRTAKTIPWYIAGDSTLFEPDNWAVLEWDVAMRSAIQTSRLIECRKTGEADCTTQYPMWTGQQDDNDEAVRIAREVDACRREKGWTAADCDGLAKAGAAAVATERGNAQDASTLAIGDILAMPPAIVLCHNPVTESDHPACGKPGLVVRTGDIRYNTVLNVEKPQTGSPWGIMVDGNDPLTGEKVAASINIWTHVTDLAAQGVVDLVRYANGELKTDEITNGNYIRDWATAAKISSGGAALPQLSSAQINARLASGASSTRPPSQ